MAVFRQRTCDNNDVMITFLSRVSMQCMQSAILLRQTRPSVCPFNADTVLL